MIKKKLYAVSQVKYFGRKIMLKAAFYLDVIGISDTGLVREHNEDAWKMNVEKSIFIIADGMGGHNAGEVASQLASETVLAILEKETFFQEEILKKAFEEANALVYKKGHEDTNYHGMGTTLLTLAIDEDCAFFAHVGDSRLYLFRDKMLKQLTSDHTLMNELISLGTMNQAEDAISFKHILTKAVGTHNKIEPSFGHFILEDGDQILLATDGLTNFISEKEITTILNKKINIHQKAVGLVELAKNHGGGDNITLILCMVLINDLSR